MPKSNKKWVLLLSCVSVFHRKMQCEHKSRERSKPTSQLEREDLQQGGPLQCTHRLPGDGMGRVGHSCVFAALPMQRLRDRSDTVLVPGATVHRCWGCILSYKALEAISPPPQLTWLNGFLQHLPVQEKLNQLCLFDLEELVSMHIISASE